MLEWTDPDTIHVVASEDPHAMSGRFDLRLQDLHYTLYLPWRTMKSRSLRQLDATIRWAAGWLYLQNRLLNITWDHLN